MNYTISHSDIQTFTQELCN